MDNNAFDFDLNNYNTSNLIHFFKLSADYTNNELIEKEKKMSLSIINDNESGYTSDYKYKILDFIKKSKQRLMTGSTGKNIPSNQDIDIRNQTNQTDSPNNILYASFEHDKQREHHINNVGKIINPLSSNPVLQKNSIPNDSVDGYNNNTIISNYVFNTRFRDNFFNTIPTSCTFTLPKTIENVMSISLSGIQFPNVIFTFSTATETTQLFIHEDNTDNEAVVVIPEGNYTWITFPGILETAINEQVIGGVDDIDNRFKVSISPYTRFITIENTVNTFKIRTITPYKTNLGICKKGSFPFDYKFDDIDIKKDLFPSQFYGTLGYQIGFRRIKYEGKQTYTSESVFDNSSIDYIYFVLNDFVGSQSTNTYGILPDSLLDKNILGIIPITAGIFNSSFDNNANFVYKTRNYFGPVNISKISVQLNNPIGNLLDIHNTEYVFVLQVTTINDIQKTYKTKQVSII